MAKKATLTTGLKENDLNYIKVKIDSGDVNTVYCNVYVMGEDGTYILEDWAIVPNDSTTHRYYYLGGSKPSEGTDLGLKGYQKMLIQNQLGENVYSSIIPNQRIPQMRFISFAGLRGDKYVSNQIVS